MANPSLTTLRARVRNRAAIKATDPRFPDQTVNRAINMAVGDVSAIRPNGFWFQHFEQRQQNVSGPQAIVPVHLADRTRTVEKLSYVFASLDNNYWLPVRQRARHDAIDYSNGMTAAAGIPSSWGAVRVSTSGGQRNQLGIQFDQPLPDQAWLRVGFVVGAGQFTADGDLMVWLMPQMVGVVIERAAETLTRQKRKQGVLTTRRKFITANALCKEAADEWERALSMWYAKAYSGPGVAHIRPGTRT